MRAYICAFIIVFSIATAATDNEEEASLGERVDALERTVDMVARVLFDRSANEVSRIAKDGPVDDTLFLMTAAAGKMASLTTASNKYALAAVTATAIGVFFIGIVSFVFIYLKQKPGDGAPQKFKDRARSR